MRFAIKLLLVALVLFLLPLAQVLAADITVNADCGLHSAISAANKDEPVGGCPAGSGADTLFLTLDISIGRELPRITSEITIDGGNRGSSAAVAIGAFSMSSRKAADDSQPDHCM